MYIFRDLLVMLKLRPGKRNRSTEKKNISLISCGKKVKFSISTECWGGFNSKQLSFEKFLQNSFLGCQWSVLEGKWISCTVEAIYLMIWARFKGRNCQSIGKLLRKNQFLKILRSGPYCTEISFSLQNTPLASLKWILKELLTVLS